MSMTRRTPRESSAPHRATTCLLPVAPLPLLLVLVSCGSDATPTSAPAPAPPTPTVATVSVQPETGELVPLETLKLEGLALDAAGTPVPGSTVNWTSGNPGIATVASDGTVTGVAPGNAQITAAAGGRTRAVTISVIPGGMVGPAGGTARFGDDVEVVVPAGAVSELRRITIAGEPAPPDDPNLIPGTAWRLTPDGSTFTQPVAVRLRYTLDSVPAGFDPRNFRVARWDGSAWQPLANTSVDVATRTVSGTTTGFSVLAIVGEPQAPGGVQWERVPGVTLPNGVSVRAWTEFDGRLWVVTGGSPFVIRSTADGVTWTTLDHEALGIPNRSLRAQGDASVAVTSTEDEIVFLFLLTNPGGGQDAAGRLGQLWVLRGDGNDWTVQENTTPGLDQMPPLQSQYNFRVQAISGAAALGDRIVVTGNTQWWLPFQTSDRSFLALSTSSQDPTWRIFADDKPPFGREGWQEFIEVVAANGAFFAAGRRSNSFEYWRSSDGLAWTIEPHPAKQEAPSFERPRIAAGEGGMVVVRIREAVGDTPVENVAWHSHDGVAWHESILEPGSFGNLRVIASRAGFVAYAQASMVWSGRVWISEDGRSWEAVADSPELVAILPLNGGLVGIDRATGVWRSGF